MSGSGCHPTREIALLRALNVGAVGPDFDDTPPGDFDATYWWPKSAGYDRAIQRMTSGSWMPASIAGRSRCSAARRSTAVGVWAAARRAVLKAPPLARASLQRRGFRRAGRLALRAPTGSGSQAWSLLVVRDEQRRREVAELVIAGGARYFAIMRPKKDGTSEEEHRQWGRDYAEQVLSTYRIAPVWLIGLLVPRDNYPAEMAAGGHEDDVISLAFALENLMLAARAEGLGTVPTTAFQRFEKDRLRAILGLPEHVDPAIVTLISDPDSYVAARDLHREIVAMRTDNRLA